MSKKMTFDKHFRMLEGGEEVTAEILGAFVHDDDIYISVMVISTHEMEMFQVLPRGLKKAPRPVFDKFIEFLKEEDSASKE